MVDHQSTLQQRWYEWVTVVEIYAHQRKGRLPLPVAYERLHAELNAACRSLIKRDGEDGDFYQRVLTLIQPWLNLAVLERADREILVDLCSRCSAISAELGGRPEPFDLSQWCRPLVLLLALAAAGGIVWTLIHHGKRAWRFLVEERQTLVFESRRIENLTLFAGAGICVLVFLYLAWRTNRG